jgi:hypothetical protein
MNRNELIDGVVRKAMVEPYELAVYCSCALVRDVHGQAGLCRSCVSRIARRVQADWRLCSALYRSLPGAQ